MSQEPDPAQLVGRTADEELLADGGQSLPESMGRPPAIPMTRSGSAIVAVGATLTGVTLIGGIIVALGGIIDAIAGGFGVVAWVALVLGVVMVSTHWGWVHVAEFSANAVHSRRNSEIEQERFRWLRTLEPYTRYQVDTEVEADGSLTISTIRHRPVPTNPGHFTFVREVLDPETIPDDRPAAVIAERAEHRRREAALMTERERARFQAAAEGRERELLGQKDEEEHLQARRAASEALAQQINTNLRDPPLTE
jgi:hypothetical protein